MGATVTATESRDAMRADGRSEAASSTAAVCDTVEFDGDAMGSVVIDTRSIEIGRRAPFAAKPSRAASVSNCPVQYVSKRVETRV